MNSPFAVVRALASTLGSRAKLAEAMGQTFGGKRNLNTVLGYKTTLTIDDYRLRARRNGVANRILKAFPQSTWRGGGELIEDDTKPEMTPFEKEWDALATRLKLWRVFYRADWMSGLGRYSTILLGAGGNLSAELPKGSGPDDLLYIRPYAEDRLPVLGFVEKEGDPRFGLPEMYRLKKSQLQKFGQDKDVHWSRVIHICEDLEEDVYGEPRLECVWNFLDDLDKVSGGGAEAFWMKANAGTQFDVDPEIEMSPEKEEELDEEVEQYIHQISRALRTRGVTATPLTTQVADFGQPISAILGLMSASTGIPQRILSGSERGELASTQDRDNWFDQVADRREQVAFPNVIQPFTDRLITYSYMQEPKEYKARWSQMKSMDEVQRADLGIKVATVNKYMGEDVILAEEVRDRVFGFPPLTDKQKQTIKDKQVLKQKLATPAVPPGTKGSRKAITPNPDQQVRSK